MITRERDKEGEIYRNRAEERNGVKGGRRRGRGGARELSKELSEHFIRRGKDESKGKKREIKKR